jgi:hypothetical protein
MAYFVFIFRIMEWTEQRDVYLAREVLVSEPFRLRPRTVERGKVWQEIANRLNNVTNIRFRVTKRSTREHFRRIIERIPRLKSPHPCISRLKALEFAEVNSFQSSKVKNLDHHLH